LIETNVLPLSQTGNRCDAKVEQELPDTSSHVAIFLCLLAAGHVWFLVIYVCTIVCNFVF